MQSIYKYPVWIADAQEINLPLGAKVLTVQAQGEAAYIWVLVDTEVETRPRRFLLRGTGHPMNGATAEHYIGTFQLRGGDLVFHLFEQSEE